MKRKVTHPAPSERALRGPRYWRTLDELAETAGFREHLEREFPDGASTLDGVDRRQFMKIMAASFALGGVGLAGCRRPESDILPFGKSVEGAIPGLPLYYATAMPLRRTAMPVLAESYQGRPTKIEGNPGYAPHGGATSLYAQASILDLYDPDRSRAHTRNGSEIDAGLVAQLLEGIAAAHASSHGDGLAFLAGSSSSPTRGRLVGALRRKFPKVRWAEYDPVRDEAPDEATRAVFGRPLRPLYHFHQAKRVVSIDADFLGAEAGSLQFAREFARARRVKNKDDPMSRLYVAESGFTLTGAMADHRLRMASSHMLAFAAALASQVTGDSSFDRFTQGVDLKPEWIADCAADLAASKGECIVVAGAHLPAAVHAVAYAINAALGNLGQTIEFVDLQAPAAQSIGELAEAIRAGSVKTLVIFGGNPVYDAPADLDWISLQKSVAQVVRLGYRPDETALWSGVNLAEAHYLESWGDGRTYDGTLASIQPLIAPLFGGLTEIEVLARIAGEPNSDPRALVEATFVESTRGSALDFKRFLHDGILSGSAYPTVNAEFDPTGLAKLTGERGPPGYPTLSETNLEVRFVADYKVDDGRFANNGWLQECPEPMTRVSWDNLILVSPKLGKRLKIVLRRIPIQVGRTEAQNIHKGIEAAPIAELTVGGRTVRGPLEIQPGLSDYTIVVPLGYGRRSCGRIGDGVGFDAYRLRTSSTPHIAEGGSLRLTGETYVVANIQEHWSMEGRALVREANLTEFREHPDFAREEGLESETPAPLGAAVTMPLADQVTQIPRGNSLYVTPKFTGLQQWGMSIDLNTCIGCQACVVACQAENNIPIVGKDQAVRGREMHWIRIDRYFSDGHAAKSPFGGEGNREIPEDPQVSLQPLPCMQCELAPCEMVCPVNATVHDDEGLNVMVYNRCVGTRYCANNCPYKVRRFNYFDWNKRHIGHFYEGPLGPAGIPELVQMVKNPEVTLRIRGVMEKCTYCIQRIENGKIQWKVKATREGRPGDVRVPDGVIKTACQQVCPVEAIVFGDILQTDSAVSQAKARKQDYTLLDYLNTRPRTTYLARLRNPNPRMPDYHSLPLSRIEHELKNSPAGFKEGADS
ncbi:MAG: TAT-variant-translocated molybdopterin oxidoreductase [Opitutaceae bacterium]